MESDQLKKNRKRKTKDFVYGTHENQISEGGEADLQKHYKSCEKNAGHTDFIPVNKFTILDLPDKFQEDDIVELIKITADLTVRVDVRKTSTERPEFFPNTKNPYAFYDIRGRNVLRIGTGRVSEVIIKDAEEFSDKTCNCQSCKTSGYPRPVRGEIIMHTATHVVFDESEASQTICKLFFDEPTSEVVVLDGWSVEELDVEEDWCKLVCVACDVDLLSRLDNRVREWSEIWDEVNSKYENSREVDKLNFIVSHPHGCPKQVSVGYWIDRYVVWEDDHSQDTMYTYTTSTCPGSSGAHVYTLGCDVAWLNHVHSGVNSKGMNFCGTGVELFEKKI